MLKDICPERAREFVLFEDGHIAIKVPKFNGRILGRFLMPRLKRPYFLVHLDEVGSFVFNCCDGLLTENEIARLLINRFPDLEDHEARLTHFLRQLNAQGHIRYRQVSR